MTAAWAASLSDEVSDMDTMETKLIDVQEVYKNYNEEEETEVRAMDGVSLEIGRGEFVAIVGA